MLNQSGIKNAKALSPVQILANTSLQASVGCIVSEDLGEVVNGRKIAKAGTPVVIDLLDLQEPVVAPTTGADAVAANAVLLHSVDVTAGNANGTALYFGVVNVNRLEDDVKALVEGKTNIGNVILIKA